MKEEIVKALRIQEESRKCKALFAVESGSRAWGFASPDSDYDVRVVYAKPVDWYLGLDEHLADTWNVMLPGELDFAAWDVRKAMRQLMKSNAAFMEWLGSPFVYHDAGFLKEMRPFIDRVFNPTHVAFHYASLFRKVMADKTEDGKISVKKLCYALRANAALRWVKERETMPPTEFARTLDGIPLDAQTREGIRNLLDLKAAAGEKDRIVPDASLSELLTDGYDDVVRHRWKKVLEPPQLVMHDLEVLFRKVIGLSE